MYENVFTLNIVHT